MQSLNDILHVARENNYSDVHLGGQNNIMIRNNGILYPYEHSYSVDDVVAMILSMLSISQKEKLEQGKDIDLVYVENMNRYRVNVYKERGQLCAALRIIYERIRSLDELHLPPVLRQLTQENRGLVLLTGPTGSGKSTTLAAMINEINQNRKCQHPNIYSQNFSVNSIVKHGNIYSIYIYNSLNGKVFKSQNHWAYCVNIS